MAVDAPVTSTRRQAAYRERQKARGYTLVQVWLPADSMNDLAAIRDRFPAMPPAEILAVAIKKARMSSVT